jgi:mRNA-degrading endonuclease YafQ of YafQ-DinJ toxin-antitoxin module
MKEVIKSEYDADLHDEEERSSKELTSLYQVFNNLISTKKFENNNFLHKSDALAVIDLAESCNMFDGTNY